MGLSHSDGNFIHIQAWGIRNHFFTGWADIILHRQYANVTVRALDHQHGTILFLLSTLKPHVEPFIVAALIIDL